MTQVVLVDAQGQPTGEADKLAAHRRPAPLHLAFSAFLRDADGRVLLQRRAATKYHFAGLWANSCCGHPLPGESVEQAAARRARDELGVEVRALRVVGSVVYRAADEASGLEEHEFDHVVVGELASDPVLDPSEVSEIELLDAAEVARRLDSSPELFAPWLAHVWPTAQPHLTR